MTKQKTHKIGDTKTEPLTIDKPRYQRIGDTDEFIYLRKGSRVDAVYRFGYKYKNLANDPNAQDLSNLNWHLESVDYTTLKTPQEVAREKQAARAARRLAKEPAVEEQLGPRLTIEDLVDIGILQRVDEKPVSWWHRLLVWMKWRKPTVPQARARRSG